jgi:hypothetical protein
MDNSFFSILIFLIVTMVYYIWLKPKLLVSTLTNIDEMQEFTKTNYIRLSIYFLLIVLSQFIINISILVNKCGGSISLNIGSAFLMTFIPWIFIFGILIVILIVFPGFKSAFSNVIGYFAVSSSANDILTELLVNQDIQKSIKKENLSDSKKSDLQSTADAIVKICGNMSILINQIVPSNFIEYWGILTPLMKEKYQNGNLNLDLKQKLLDVVVMRDNIGEALWFIYTALLLISITQYNIATRPCVKDLKAMEQNQQKFQEEQAKVNENTQKAQATIYTINQ